MPNAKMIDPFGFTRRSRRNRHIAWTQAQVTARCPGIFEHLVAEETSVEHQSFVDIPNGQRNMIHSRDVQYPSIRTRLTYRRGGECEQRVAPANAIERHFVLLLVNIARSRI